MTKQDLGLLVVLRCIILARTPFGPLETVGDTETPPSLDISTHVTLHAAGSLAAYLPDDYRANACKR